MRGPTAGDPNIKRPFITAYSMTPVPLRWYLLSALLAGIWYPLSLTHVGRMARLSSPRQAVQAPPVVSSVPADSFRHVFRYKESGFRYALRAVAADSASFRALWTEAVRGNPDAPPMPQIEFEHNMVIVAAMGGVPSTGYSIRIDSVLTRGGSLEVHVLLTSPGMCLVGPAFTEPVDIVEVARLVHPVVVFRDRHVAAECRPF